MNFLEAVKRLDTDCYSNMYRQNKYNERVILLNDVLCYVNEKIYYDGTKNEYVPTSHDMLADDWLIGSDAMVNGIKLIELKDKKIKNIEYIGYHFVFTLDNGKKYKFLGDSCEGSSAVGITEITG